MNNTITGKITTTRKGLGFITDPALAAAGGTKDKNSDIAIEAGFLATALNGDMVEVTIKGKVAGRNGPQITGEVTKILERAKETFVGTVDTEQGFFFVVLMTRKCTRTLPFLPKRQRSKISRKIKRCRSSSTFPPGPIRSETRSGHVVRVLGHKGENNVEMESIVLEKGFEMSFPAGVEEEAERIEKNKAITPEEIAKRRDIRDTMTFTIDPFDAKDFDDAISFKPLSENLYEIGIHIADVSHYVTEGSALDKEAVKRGCSIYLVDRTIPMLPEVLSNDVCSLNPHEDKLTFSAIFTIDDKAKIHTRWVWSYGDEFDASLYLRDCAGCH